MQIYNARRIPAGGTTIVGKFYDFALVSSHFGQVQGISSLSGFASSLGNTLVMYGVSYCVKSELAN